MAAMAAPCLEVSPAVLPRCFPLSAGHSQPVAAPAAQPGASSALRRHRHVAAALGFVGAIGAHLAVCRRHRGERLHVARAKADYDPYPWLTAQQRRAPVERLDRPPRVRFAPSPTGVLHVGGARTALFNYLFAKANGGELILRVEDTDVARSTPESEKAIMEGLRWCGIEWDEGPDKGGSCGPYRQSERIEDGIYEAQLQKLTDDGHVYKCFLTAKELDDMRREAERNDQAFVVDSPWARASEDEVQEMLDKGAPFVYRFRVPFDKTIEINDVVLGEVEWHTDDMGGDFVIVRGNGMPMYNFGVAVDDAQMGITHVLRAQEHLSNTPKQILIYEALGYEPPRFAHMPLILAPDRTKLSKRHGAVSVGDYQKMGYLPASMVNYLAQLGWNDGTNQEIYDLSELLEAFRMDRMSKVAAIFDLDKFKWVNGHHIRKLSADHATELIGEELVRSGVVKEASSTFVSRACLLLRDRISVLSEAGEALKKMLLYPLDEVLESDECRPFVKDGSIAETAALLCKAEEADELQDIGKDPKALKKLAAKIGEDRGVKKKKLMMPLRICLTGSMDGPDMRVLFHLLAGIDDNVVCDYVKLEQRMAKLKEAFEL